MPEMRGREGEIEVRENRHGDLGWAGPFWVDKMGRATKVSSSHHWRLGYGRPVVAPP